MYRLPCNFDYHTCICPLQNVDIVMFSRPSAIQFGGGGPGGVVVVVVVVERGHAGYSSIETVTARRAFVWQAENRWTEETLQRPTEPKAILEKI